MNNQVTRRLASPAGRVKVGSPLAELPGGPVTVTLKKGKARRQVSATLSKKGEAKLALPRVPAGKWRVTASYSGDARYETASRAKNLRVKR